MENQETPEEKEKRLTAYGDYWRTRYWDENEDRERDNRKYKEIVAENAKLAREIELLKGIMQLKGYLA